MKLSLCGDHVSCIVSDIKESGRGDADVSHEENQETGDVGEQYLVCNGHLRTGRW